MKDEQLAMPLRQRSKAPSAAEIDINKFNVRKSLPVTRRVVDDVYFLRPCNKCLRKTAVTSESSGCHYGRNEKLFSSGV
jgi:hypothetical protein